MINSRSFNDGSANADLNSTTMNINFVRGPAKSTIGPKGIMPSARVDYKVYQNSGKMGNAKKAGAESLSAATAKENIAPTTFSMNWDFEQLKQELSHLALPKYLVAGKRLGKGGWGDVFMVTRINDGKKLAAKIVPFRDSTFLQDVTSVQTEVQTLKLLKGCGNYIVEFEDYVTVKNHAIILMEYCERGDLIGYLNANRSRRDCMTDLMFLRDILRGVQLMHNRGVAHRDIKLGNILLGNDNCLKLTDFGQSFISSEGRKLSNDFAGTPLFAAPEMANKRNYDPFKADIWSVGISFYAILTRRMPFSKELWMKRKGRFTQEDVECVLSALRTCPISVGCLYILKSFLEVDPALRITLDAALMLCDREIDLFQTDSSRL